MRIKAEHERFFNKRFDSIRELFVARREYLRYHGKLHVNWKAIAADFGISQMQAHQMFRRLELDHLSNITSEQKDFIQQEMLKLHKQGIQRLVMKKMISNRLPNDIQFKNFDNFFNTCYRRLEPKE
jgi:hypothetical protein